MPSNAARGAYYKGRSKEYLQKLGLQVGEMELVRIIRKSDGEQFPTKKDQFGSDLLYLYAGGVVFVQCKGGGRSSTVLTREAQDGFDEYSFPSNCRIEVHIWRSRARVPEVVECHKTNVL